MNYMRATIPTRYRGMVDMVDMALPCRELVRLVLLVDTNKFADNIHSSIVGTWGRLPRSAQMLCARVPQCLVDSPRERCGRLQRQHKPKREYGWCACFVDRINWHNKVQLASQR